MTATFFLKSHRVPHAHRILISEMSEILRVNSWNIRKTLLSKTDPSYIIFRNRIMDRNIIHFSI